MILGIFSPYQLILEQPQQLQDTVWHSSHVTDSHLTHPSLPLTTNSHMLKTPSAVALKPLHWVHKTLNH